MRSPIYLDNASTTCIAPEIAELLAELFGRFGANPASQHRAGRAALAAIEDAKDRIKLALLGNDSAGESPDAWRVVITSGGTEANNLAIQGLCADSSIFVSAVEHPSLLVPATVLPLVKSRSTIIDIKRGSWELNIDALAEKLAACSQRSERPLVSVMLGNNETGLIADIERISSVCRQYGAILHSDCVQAVGKLAPATYLPFVDAITLSAHKLHGPVGVGALLIRSSVPLRPLLFGGGQQLELRPGTESVPLTTALAAAIEIAEQYRQSGQISHIAHVRDHFEAGLCPNGASHLLVPPPGARHDRSPPGASQSPSPARPALSDPLCDASSAVHVIGASHLRLPHISSIAFPGRDRQALLMALDLAGVQCSSGSACASGSSQPSHVLSALGLPEPWIAGALRFSFSRYTTLDDVDEAVARIKSALARQH